MLRAVSDAAHPAQSPLSLHETAAMVSVAARVEQRLFELLGRWVPTTGDLGLKQLFADHSYRHVEHADLLRALLPAGIATTGEPVIGPAATEATAVARALKVLATAATSIDRATGVYRVV